MEQSLCEEAVLQALHGVKDPEVGVNIVDLGLVYLARRTGDAIDVHITTTSPACPLGDTLTRDTEEALQQSFPDVGTINVEIVYDPPWTPDRMTESGREQLGLPPR